MKNTGEIMEILEAFDLVGSYRGAAELAGCSHHTVERYVAHRDQRRDATLSVRPKMADRFEEKIAEWVSRSKGKIRADVVHEELLPLGYRGSERTTRRAVAEAKKTYGQEKRRVYRPWITEPGGWLQFDWGKGPSVTERRTSLFCAWLAWSRFRVIIPTWDRTLATTLACLDETFRRLGGVPTYVLTDNEKTVTTEHVAGIPVRHPEIAACGRHYGTKIVTCVVADPESKGGSEAAVRVAKADLVPTDSNLAPAYPTFASLREEAHAFCEKVNARPHRATGRPPADMLEEERARLHPVPACPYLGALGETRVVNRSSVISLGATRYSVPHQLIDETVFCRLEGDEVVICHNGPNGVCEVARHRRALPGNPQLDLTHYPPRSSSKILSHTPRPRTPEEAAFLKLGPGASLWLEKAAAAGTARIRTKMGRATELAAIYGIEEVDAALAASAEAGRFACDDLESFLGYRRTTAGSGTVVPLSEAPSLQPGTGRWKELCS